MTCDTFTNQDIIIDKVRDYLDKGFKTRDTFNIIKNEYKLSKATVYKYIQKAKNCTSKSESYFYSST